MPSFDRYSAFYIDICQMLIAIKKLKNYHAPVNGFSFLKSIWLPLRSKLLAKKHITSLAFKMGKFQVAGRIFKILRKR